MIMGGLDTVSSTVASISLIGAAATPVGAGFMALANGNSVLTALIPALKRWFPDYTVDQLNRLNDLGFSASSNYKIIVPKGGAIPFVTFIPQGLFPTPTNKWTPVNFQHYESTSRVLVAGALIQELTNSPSITSLSPASGPPGTVVTIAGANFGDTRGSSVVKLGGQSIESIQTGAIKSWSATSIGISIPDMPTGPIPVVVSVNNADSAASQFMVAPTISSLSSVSGVPDKPITITGKGFGASSVGNSVKFGLATATISSWSPTSIVAAVPNLAAGAANVVVTVNGAAGDPAQFTVSAPPVIASLTPSSGPPSSTVTISGTEFRRSPAFERGKGWLRHSADHFLVSHRCQPIDSKSRTWRNKSNCVRGWGG